LHATIASGCVRLATDGGAKVASAAARESIETDLAIPYDCKLTAQETRWSPML
jgi:hypothetical protein